MPREEAIVFNLPDSTSPGIFQSYAKEYLPLLQERETGLLRISLLLASTYWIWSHQGTQILSFLYKFSEILQRFLMLMEEFQQLSVFLSNYRLIIMSMQNTNENIRVLTRLLEYVCTTHVPSQKYDRYRQDIRRTFELIMRSYTETLKDIPMLLDQTHFLKKS